MKKFNKTKLLFIKELILHEKTFSVVAGSVLIATFLFLSTGILLAEQQGSTPESGVTSRIASLSSDLADLGYGSTSDTPDWGSDWNRVKTSSKWVPNGTATASNIISGKTFYDSNRTSQTGTYTKLAGCSGQLYTDSSTSSTQSDNCNVTWLTPSDNITGSDKLDPRTNLVWSYHLGWDGSNVIFSSTSPVTFNYYTGHERLDGTDGAACHNRGNGWRLPSEKELMQAYVDGSYYNLTDPTTTNYWSNINGPSYWVSVSLADGSVGFFDWRNDYYVRCVRAAS